MNLTINGTAHQIDAPEDMPLLWAIRDLVGLKGAKFGCGVQACGACSVLIDGEIARSCGVAVADAVGTEITTIEGLAEDGELTAVQQAWIDAQVPQCGYCQSGQIIAATALLAETPNPTDEDIDAAMTNLCRCGTYPQIRAAIKRAAVMQAASLQEG
ncbi:MAG: (2Fe-2S)-binding protein [Pseudomonadota bacterium]